MPNPPMRIEPPPPAGHGKGEGSVWFADKAPTAALPYNVIYFYKYSKDMYLADYKSSFTLATQSEKNAEKLRSILQEELMKAAMQQHAIDTMYAETVRPRVTFDVDADAALNTYLPYDDVNTIPFHVQWTDDWVEHIDQQRAIEWCYKVQDIIDAQHSHTPPAWMMYVFPAMFLIFIGLFVWKCCSPTKKFLKRRRKGTDTRHLCKTPVAPALAPTWPRPRSRDFV